MRVFWPAAVVGSALLQAILGLAGENNGYCERRSPPPWRHNSTRLKRTECWLDRMIASITCSDLTSAQSLEARSIFLPPQGIIPLWRASGRHASFSGLLTVVSVHSSCTYIMPCRSHRWWSLRITDVADWAGLTILPNRARARRCQNAFSLVDKGSYCRSPPW